MFYAAYITTTITSKIGQIITQFLQNM